MDVHDVQAFAVEFLEGWYRKGPHSVWIVGLSFTAFTLFALVYVAVYLVSPLPRPPFASETTYRTVNTDGKVSGPQQLPDWETAYMEKKAKAEEKEEENDGKEEDGEISEAEILVSLVVPAYNEQDRLGPMLEEAVEFLDRKYSDQTRTSETLRRRKPPPTQAAGLGNATKDSGWEILVVSDGSTDKTEETALDFARRSPGGFIRVIRLASNRGKGGAVVHGMRHVRGQYVIFADADGASKFSDLEKMIEACDKVKDARGRAVAVGSRAHLVGSSAVVNRSALRNFLMHSFHLLLWLFTPAATSRIRDTQCGFKLFSRPSLPYIVPHMHSEGWIFDVEMLMLAEQADIPMIEVPIGWHEVKGSKLNVVWDSLGMAWGLFVLRAAWALGVYETHTGPLKLRISQHRQIVYEKGMPKPY